MTNTSFQINSAKSAGFMSDESGLGTGRSKMMVKHKAWAATIVVPKSENSVDTKGQMKPLSGHTFRDR